MPLAPLHKRIFAPIRAILDRLLLGLPHQALSDPATRARLIQLADLALTSEFPAARALPAPLRRRIIGEVLDTVLGTPRTAAAAAAFAADPVGALDMSTDELASAEAAAPGNSVLGFLTDGETADQSAMDAAVAEVLGAGWVATLVDADSASFTITHADAVLSVSEAWELAHKLEDHTAVALAEPNIEWVPAPPEIGGAAPDATVAIAGFGGDDHLSCSGVSTWSADELRVDAAWNASAPNRKQGVGVKVAHLDTGITDHALLPLNDARILLSQGANLYDPGHPVIGNRPLDPMDASWDDFLRTWFIAQEGHGTGTLSVLLSQAGDIKGTAPRVTVIPYRIGPTVVHWNVQRITEGIRRAHAAGCDVITMSMGGAPSRTGGMEKAVKRAAEDGVIFCSAAANVIGSNNLTPIVVWPAALDEVIAVAGSNCKREVWSGSSRGPEVNISAPAQDVWRVSAKRGALPGSGIQGSETGRGSGTSYATPATAGIAACWLAHHGGRAAIAAHYGHPRYVPMAFAHLLRTVAFNTPPKWRTDLLGPGILDAGKLLAVQLPPKAALNGWPKKKHSLSSKVLGGIFRGWHWLTGGSPAMAAAASAAGAFPTEADAEEFVQRYGSELTYLLYDRPALLQRLADAGLLDDKENVAASVSAAAVAPDDGTLTRAAEALTSLKQLASPSLAAALP